MEKRRTSGYIYLGTVIRYLIDARPGIPIHHEGSIVENLLGLRGKLNEYEFFVTERVAEPLWRQLSDWEKELSEHESEEGWAGTRVLTEAEGMKLRETSRLVRETALAEAAGKTAFIASDKRYTVEKLLEDIGSLFGNGVFNQLPELARFDFAEGGKALAYELPTSAAFHFLRATEAVLRDFYCQVVKRDRISEPRMWAGMVRDMRGKRRAPSELLLDNLDSLRSHFRNPTQHPEKTYDLDETQDLLALAIDSVNRMVRHLEAAA
jgi:hypothetical protein